MSHTLHNLILDWGKPERDQHWCMQTIHVQGIIVSDYLCVVYPVFVAHVFPIYVLKWSVYPGILIMLYVQDCHLKWARTARTKATLCLMWRLLTKTGTWMRRHMGINGLSLLRQRGCSGLATSHSTCVNWLIDWLYYCFVMHKQA